MELPSARATQYVAEHKRGSTTILSAIHKTKEDAEKQIQLWKEEYMGMFFPEPPCIPLALHVLVRAENMAHFISRQREKRACDVNFDAELSDEQFLHAIHSPIKRTTCNEQKESSSSNSLPNAELLTKLQTLNNFDGSTLSAVEFFRTYQDYEGESFDILVRTYRSPHIMVDAKFFLSKILTPLSKSAYPDVEDWWSMYANHTKEKMTITPHVSGFTSVRESLPKDVSISAVLHPVFPLSSFQRVQTRDQDIARILGYAVNSSTNNDTTIIPHEVHDRKLCVIVAWWRRNNKLLQHVCNTMEEANDQLKVWKKEWRNLYFEGKKAQPSAFDARLSVSNKTLSYCVEKYGTGKLREILSLPDWVEPEDITKYPFGAVDLPPDGFLNGFHDYTGEPFDVRVKMNNANLDEHLPSNVLLEQILIPLSKGELPDFLNWWGIYQKWTKDVFTMDVCQIGPSARLRAPIGNRLVNLLGGGRAVNIIDQPFFVGFFPGYQIDRILAARRIVCKEEEECFEMLQSSIAIRKRVKKKK